MVIITNLVSIKMGKYLLCESSQTPTNPKSNIVCFFCWYSSVPKCFHTRLLSSISPLPRPRSNCDSLGLEFRQFKRSSFTSSAAMSCDQQKYHWIDGAESLDKYRSGGWHPVIIGDEKQACSHGVIRYSRTRRGLI